MDENNKPQSLKQQMKGDYGNHEQNNPSIV